MKKNKIMAWRQLSLSGILLGITSASFASGFQLFDEGVAGAGNAHADWAAGVYDASTGFYNPAGLADLTTPQLVLGGTLINVDSHFTGTASTALNGIVNQYGPVTGAVQGGGLNFIPNMHLAYPLQPGVTLGLDVTVPFGLQTDWGEDSIVRYANVVTRVQVIDISPSIGLAVNDKFSLGLGFDASNMQAVFSSMAGLGPDNSFDALIRNVGSAWGYGWHGGLLYKFTPATRVGLSYYSSVRYDVAGDSDYLNKGSQAGLVAPSSTLHNLQASVRLPATTVASIYHDLTPRWAVMGSVMYTQWNVIQELTLNNVNYANIPIDVTIPTHYRNTWAFAAGANYKLTDQVTLRSGVMYDQTPLSNAYRNLRLPDANRLTVALGAHYQMNKALGFDLAYQHLFVHDAPINNTVIEGPTATQEYATIIGNTFNKADVIGAQMVWNMGA